MNESTLNQLYQNTVAGFPRTKMRQHATQPVVITNLDWLPFVGMQTLFIKGLAQNEGRESTPMLLFKRVIFNPRKEGVKIAATDRKEYLIERISPAHNEIVVRCSCKDFRWRFAYFNHLDDSLYGRKPAAYESKHVRPPANPLGLSGACKHILKMVQVLEQAGIFVS